VGVAADAVVRGQGGDDAQAATGQCAVVGGSVGPVEGGPGIPDGDEHLTRVDVQIQPDLAAAVSQGVGDLLADHQCDVIGEVAGGEAGAGGPGVRSGAASCG
jgi:hypothetical protein